MKEYSFTEARQHFASVLDAAKREGVVCIKKKNGDTYLLKPVISKKSPLDIKGVKLDVSSKEIVDIIRSGRERN
jgi:PHD/YefM family antitoxin component YafN of YafNO toxin-antitoxin module